ncbi:MAG: hypothetical protein AAB345_03075 [Patescibacteria group bacterium]|mgnify:CR=1 FL=1
MDLFRRSSQSLKAALTKDLLEEVRILSECRRDPREDSSVDIIERCYELRGRKISDPDDLLEAVQMLEDVSAELLASNPTMRDVILYTSFEIRDHHLEVRLPPAPA